MRVLHLISSPTLTGAAAPAFGLALGLARLGVDVVVAFDQRRTGDLAAKVRAAGLPVLPGLSLSSRGAPIHSARDLVRLSRLARGFDLVHCHATHDHVLAAAAGLSGSIVRSIHHERSLRPSLGRAPLLARSRAYFAADQRLRTALLALAPRATVEVLPGAVDVERFRPSADRGYRVRFGIPAHVRLLGLVSRIKPGRGHAELLDALARVPDLWLALIGSGEGVFAVDEQIRALGLAERVRRFGYLDAELPRALASLDGLILLRAGNDAGGRAVLEAMAAGRPVLVGGIPALDAVVDAQVGYRFDPAHGGSLVESLRAFRDAPASELEAKGRAARARIEADFTEPIRARRALAAYLRWCAR